MIAALFGWFGDAVIVNELVTPVVAAIVSQLATPEVKSLVALIE